MATFAKVKRKPIKLECEHLDGIYLKNVPMSVFQDVFSMEEEDGEETADTLLRVVKELLVDEAGEHFDEFLAAESVEDLNNVLSVGDIRQIVSAIVAYGQGTAAGN